MKNFPFIFLVIAIFAAPIPSHAQDIGRIISGAVTGFTQLAEAAKEITPSEEHYIGRAVAAKLLSQYRLLNSTSLTDYVNKVGLVVAYSSDRPVTYGGYHFAVLDTDAVNAFACPGGLIFVTNGLLRQMTDEDQLAAVLGHEITHVAKRHGIGAIKKSRWTKFAFYTAGEIGKNYAPNEIAQLVQEFQGVVEDVAKTVINNGYSRDAEVEADRDGLLYASRAGYAPEAMALMLEKQIDAGGQSGPFSSHPKALDRTSMIRTMIAEGSIPSISIDPARTARFRQIAGTVK